MGEAKRRKALDSTFGKITKRSSPVLDVIEILEIVERGNISPNDWQRLGKWSEYKTAEYKESYQSALHQSNIDASCKSTCEKTALIDELRAMSLSQGWVQSPERDVYLGENLKRVREIGQRLHDIGGMDLMYYAALFIPKYDHRELDYAWDEIGEWLC